MKNYYVTILFIILSIQTIWGQEGKFVVRKEKKPTEAVSPSSSVVRVSDVDKRPEFEPDIDEYVGLLHKKLRLDYDTIPVGTYRVIVSFCVEADGTLSDIKITKDPGFGIGEEVKRVMPLMPKWKPAEKNGKPVRTVMSLPFFIKISS